ncbi:MAG: restriction endonuclease [Planctomycetaceae bacterium]|nr:MAG: restriction endonuclease [Planctomycetaceae bacterium]
MTEYSKLTFKVPQESPDYLECSDFVTTQIEAIIGDALKAGKNKIIINTNLRLGLPMENINKIAGPFVEAWAAEIFQDVSQDANNQYQLIHVEAQERLYKADIILQFKKTRNVASGVTAEVDVKATSEDFTNSGKSPNITSFERIRTAYIEDPDYIFVILSLKHRVYSTRNETTGLMDGIMEIVAYNAYDLKYISNADLSYNPALGTGQIQIKDIHYITRQNRTTWEFCQLLDAKYLGSSKRTLDDWIALATKGEWIKTDDCP